MRRTSRDFTDFYDHPEDRITCIAKTWLVVISQVMGVLLIGVCVFSLQNPTWPISKYWVGMGAVSVGILFLAAWGIYCWHDRFLTRSRQYKNGSRETERFPFSRRITRLIRGTLALVIADTLLLAVLMGMTGGVGSPLDPLLPAIPIIAIVLRQPYRTIAWALGLSVSVILFFTICNLVHPLHSPWIYDAHKDESYRVVLGIIALGVFALSMFEYWLSYQTPPILVDVTQTVEHLLRSQRPDLTKELSKGISRGTRGWLRWLSRRGMPLKDLSIVHSEQDVIRQAVVLALPYWIDDLPRRPSRLAFFEWIASALMFVVLKVLRIEKNFRPCSEIVLGWSIAIKQWWLPVGKWQELRRRRKITRNITFLTLAAHWVDDHFDALEQHCPVQLHREMILKDSPDGLLDRRLIPRLNEVVHGMERRANRQNRLQVRNAVKRIIYGGLVQNASSRERLKQLHDEYLNFISQNLFGEQKQIYQKLAKSKRPLNLFLTAKVVMELLDSCSWRSDPSRLIKEAEFFNLLYCPILYYHDWDEELAWEQYGKAFGNSTDVERHLPTPQDLVQIVKSCEGLLGVVFRGQGLSAGRRAQLHLLLELYRAHLPQQLFNAYRQFLDFDATRLAVTPPPAPGPTPPPAPTVSPLPPVCAEPAPPPQPTAVDGSDPDKGTRPEETAA